MSIADSLRSVRQAAREKEWGKVLATTIAAWHESLQKKHTALAALTEEIAPLAAEAFLPAYGRPNQCALLASARQSSSQQSSSQLHSHCRSIVELVEQTRRRLMNEDQTHTSYYSRVFQSLQFRAETIQSFAGGSDASDPGGQIQTLLRTLRSTMSSDLWDDLACPIVGRPAAWHHLEQVNSVLAARLNVATQSTSNHKSWRDPAAAALCHTFLVLQPEHKTILSDNKADDDIGATWILIAMEIPGKNPSGLLLQLRIKAIPNGCGILYPDPFQAAHVITDRSFQQSIRNAWSVVLGHIGQSEDLHHFDYVWSLTVMDTTDESSPVSGGKVVWNQDRKLMLYVPFSGRSGELAFAAALKSAVKNVPLDRSRVVSATFADELPIGANPSLGPIAGVPQKEIGIERCERAAHLARIEEVVVFFSQTWPFPVKRTIRAASEFLGSTGVWRWLSQHSKLTAAFKSKQALKTRRFFADYCFGDADADDPCGDYILTPMSRPPDKRDPAHARKADRETGEVRPIPLSKDDRVSLLRGHLRLDPDDGDRVRPIQIVADSGLGKSTLLQRIRYEVANDRGPRIPVLLTNLSDWLQYPERDNFLKTIASRFLRSLPKQTRLQACTNEESDSDQLPHEWFRRKVRRGEVVFLLDALDQTSAHWDNLGALVDQIPECPIYLTRRPADQSTRPTAFTSGPEWDQINLEPLTEDDAVAYLAEFSKWFITRLRDKERGESDSILHIPLVLHLLKDFARENQLHADSRSQATQLPELKNRYTIYHHVICGPKGMVARGYESLRSSDPQTALAFSSREDAVEKMSRIALWQLTEGNHHFDTTVTGLLFQRLEQDLLTELFQYDQRIRTKRNAALKQLDLVTASSMIEGEDGFAWKHRSSLEFMAGIRLACLVGSDREDDQRIASQILFDIHNCLEDGKIRLFHSRDNPDGDGYFRDLPGDWHWTLRFALAHAESNFGRDAGDRLALELISLGNPWIVYESMSVDAITFSDEIEDCALWLVQQNRSPGKDYVVATRHRDRDAVRNSSHGVAKQTRIGHESTVLSRLFDRHTRDAGTLANATSLLESAESLPWSEPHHACDLNIVREALQPCLTESRFVSLLPPYERTEMADFPVTNAWFELFCPSHRRTRSRYSDDDEQPVVYVSAYMAEMFCRWLSVMGPDSKYIYRLPTDDEWTSACEWETKTERWWKNEFDPRLCWSGRGALESRTRSREEAIAAFTSIGRWHPSYSFSRNGGVGLLDMLGNVWEWTGCTASHSRVRLRGESFYRYEELDVRSAYRYHLGPDLRRHYIGFRVVRVLRVAS